MCTSQRMCASACVYDFCLDVYTYVCVRACVHILGAGCVPDTLHLALLQLTDGAPYGVSQFLPHAPITMYDLCFFNRQTAVHTHADRTCNLLMMQEKHYIPTLKVTIFLGRC